MKATLMVAALLIFSATAYAQTQTDPKPEKHRRTSEERAAFRAEMKAKLEKMTPEERKAFRLKQREQHQARINAMTPEQRERFMRRRDAHKGNKPEKS